MQAAAKAVWARAEGKLCLVHGHIHFSVRETQSDAMQSRERSACAVVQHIGERLFSDSKPQDNNACTLLL